ncbi:complement C5-like [Scleropages formosus]|uniref:complement C5-like n=1 Tax=Scleropages formosus TaxID=113540 RepID=UPI0010FAC417|nr:complement C5-like [Scleropages formosus]
MRELPLLLGFLCLCWRTEAQDKMYLITAPKVLRLDASETVVVQLFGYNEESTFIVSLKSYPDKRQTFATQSVTLSSANRFQDVATLRLLPRDFPKEASYVYLEARSTDFTREEKVEVTRENGFLFIQTDKPLYNPEQSVKVRVFSLDEELRPALRPVTLTFIDPDAVKMDIVELRDVSGVLSMQTPFKIPLKPKCGVWRIEATYTDDFSTQATAEFEVKEYVLPSISVQIQPEASYISSVTFHSFKLTVTARYVHGSPVSSAQVFLRFGYTEGSQTTIIPNTVTKQQLIDGFLEVSINVEEALKLLEDSGPRTLQDMDGKFLYVAVSLRETDGGISQEAELATVKFLQSPFTMALVATPPFIKPGLPYSLRVLVKDPLGQPVGQVPVKVRATMTNNNGEESLLDYSGTTEGYAQTSRNDGTAIFIYNMPSNSKAAVFTLETADKSLSPSNQAMLRHETTAYYSINKRYLYIDWASHYQELNVGDYITINVYFHHYSNIPLQTFSYQVISKGKIVKFDTVNRYGGSNHQAINFQVTPDMVPSARLLVYYIMTGENIAELVADSVWINVKGKCVNDLQMRLSAPTKEYSPKDNLALTVKAKHNSLVALSSIDTAIYNLKAFRKDPMTRVLRHIEQSDHGCGGGGGKDNADVFRLAGLTFMTNANAKAAQLEDETCSAITRPKRQAGLTPQMQKKVRSYKHLKNCCLAGIKTIPTLDTCSARARRLSNSEECKKAFRECCEFRLKLEHQNKNELQLARMEIELEFGLEAPRVRSYFPESWLWETHRISDRSGLFSLSKPLPDSLTTWEIKAVGMFSEGICVADALRVQVTQKVSLDVPLPYSMVRGEQVELRGSVYNQYFTSSWFCVTLTVPKGVCLLQGRPTEDGQAQSTPCIKTSLKEESVTLVSFTLMALEAGSHTLRFTLKSPLGSETLIKTLRVVPEGIRTELNTGGTLDPQGVYGNLRRRLEFKNSIPLNLVPKSNVERLLTVNGELLGDIMFIMTDPKGLYQLTNLPRGSAEVEIMGILPIYYVFHYLEETERWDLLGDDTTSHRVALKRKLKEGITSVMSFRKKLEYGYSMWKDREASTWLTALVVKTFGQVDKYVTVDRRSLCNSLFWLQSSRQNADGSFKELADYKPLKLMGAGANVKEQAAYLTSFVIIGIKNAMAVPECSLEEFNKVLKNAERFLFDNIKSLKNMYVRAITAYSLALLDKSSIPARELYETLQNYAQVKGNPPVVRFWQEQSTSPNPSAPNKASAQSVETTVYVLLMALLYGDSEYAAPIIRWLSQDQRYGGGFQSTQDTVLTLEALTKYSTLVKHAKLDMEIRASYRNKGELEIIKLSQRKPVGKAIQVNKDDDVVLITGSSTGVSVANMKTVYYTTTQSNDNCHFHLTIEVHPPVPSSSDPMLLAPRLVACAKYNPRDNEVYTESAHTVMEIHLPTGMQPFQEDLEMMQNGLESVVSHYEIKEDQVILQLDTIPSDTFLCVGFRMQELFRTGMVSSSLFKVYEYRDPDSQCSKLYHAHEERKLLQLCEGDQCQCMTASCSFVTEMDLSITAQKRLDTACQDKIRYAFKVQIEYSKGEGDFVNYVAKIEDVFKKGTENVQRNTEVTFVKKATCTDVKLQDGAHYLIMGAEGMQILHNRRYKYKFPLDSEAWVEKWPTASDCKGKPCSDFLNIMEDFAEDFLLMGCP